MLYLFSSEFLDWPKGNMYFNGDGGRVSTWKPQVQHLMGSPGQ